MHNQNISVMNLNGPQYRIRSELFFNHENQRSIHLKYFTAFIMDSDSNLLLLKNKL